MGFLGVSLLVALAGIAALVVPRLLETRTSGAAAVGRDTMRAIHYAASGAPGHVLEMLEDAPVPSFGPRQLLVEVHAAALNPVDYKIVQGNFDLIDVALTHRPGFDFAGRVVAVGVDCKGKFAVGQMVHGMTWVHQTGTLAEFLAIDESVVARVPAGQSVQEAAGLPLVGHTSLFTSKFIRKDDSSRVLILGGGSATGMAALQIAKAWGAARIVTTCSPRNDALAKSLGADETINYREQDVWTTLRERGEQFDLVYDTIASPMVWPGATSGVLARGGALVTITGDSQGPMGLAVLLERAWQIVSRNLFLFFGHGGASYHQHTQPGGNGADLEALNAAGVRAFVDGSTSTAASSGYAFTLEGVKAAFQRQMSGSARGKVVVTLVTPPDTPPAQEEKQCATATAATPE